MELEFNTENLIKILDYLKLTIESGECDIEKQQELWDLLTWNKNTLLNKQLIKYMFLGWWINKSLITF